MQSYVLGFVVDEINGSVLLIKKERPHFLAGKLNGLGGKIEADESPMMAMTRETLEECDVFIPPNEWFLMGVLGNAHLAHQSAAPSSDQLYTIFVFSAVAPLHLARQTTDEQLTIVSWPQLEQMKQMNADAFCPDVLEMLGYLAPSSTTA